MCKPWCSLICEAAWPARPCTPVFFFDSQTGRHAVAVRFQQTINKSALDYLPIIYSVASIRLLPQGFGRFRWPLNRRLCKLHHIRVCFRDYFVRCIHLEQIADSLTVGCYYALFLTVMQLLFPRDMGVERGRSGVLHLEL